MLDSPREAHRRVLAAAAGHLRTFGFRDCHIAKVLGVRQECVRRLAKSYHLPPATKGRRPKAARICQRSGCNNPILSKPSRRAKYCSYECFTRGYGQFRRRYDDIVLRSINEGISVRAIAAKLGLNLRRVMYICARLRTEGKLPDNK